MSAPAEATKVPVASHGNIIHSFGQIVSVALPGDKPVNRDCIAECACHIRPASKYLSYVAKGPENSE